MRARNYEPTIGRFLTEDPARDGLNWYNYCGNDPVNYWDPSGENLISTLVTAAAIATVSVLGSGNHSGGSGGSGSGGSGSGSSTSTNKLTSSGTQKNILATGAGIYASYYLGIGLNTAIMNSSSYFASGNIVGGALDMALSLTPSLIAINNITQLDSKGLVQGFALNVPVYNQFNTPPMDGSNRLCWAASAAMVASFILGDNNDRTLSIAQTVTGRQDIGGYNIMRLWASTDILDLGITAFQRETGNNLSMEGIKAVINQGKPFGALYTNIQDNNGHWVVGIGYAAAPGYPSLVVSNDPSGGVQRIQTYNDFQTYFDGRKWVWTAR